MNYYLITFLIGCISALAELVSRYERIIQIFSFLSSWVYFILNGFASVFAYWAITEYNIDLGPLTSHETGKILLAGTSSVIILRSSFANIKIGGKDYNAGFASITQIFLKSADRAFDQKRSIDDYNAIEKIMANIDFDKVKIDLPIICLNIMKNVSLDEQKLLGDEVHKLSENSESKRAKSINLGILVAKVTGIELLKTVVNSLNSEDDNNDRDNDNIFYSRKRKLDQLLERLK